VIIHHSMKILEQLSEIESLIQQVESLLTENGIEIDREKLLMKILKNQEMTSISRQKS
jgi:regulator of replication initiation timing